VRDLEPELCAGISAPVKAIFDGWELSGIFVAQSGHPYSGLVNFDLNNDGNSATDRTPGLGRNTFYLPASISLDPRVTRAIPITERIKMQLIWETFNVLNHSNIVGVRTNQYAVSSNSLRCGAANAPCLIPTNTGINAFGMPTSSSGPRIMQVSIKLVL